MVYAEMYLRALVINFISSRTYKFGYFFFLAQNCSWILSKNTIAQDAPVLARNEEINRKRIDYCQRKEQ